MKHWKTVAIAALAVALLANLICVVRLRSTVMTNREMLLKNRELFISLTQIARQALDANALALTNLANQTHQGFEDNGKSLTSLIELSASHSRSIETHSAAIDALQARKP